MSTWTTADATRITQPQEVQVQTRRADDTLRSPRIIWIVRHEDRVFVRSTNGRGADWFSGAVATGTGRILAAGSSFDVRFVEVDDATDLELVATAYRAKYGHYASIVDHLMEEGPRAATLEVLPA